MTAKRYSGTLVAFEGIDGSGKTTQAKKLAGVLDRCGIAYVTSKEPTTGPWGQKIRESKTKGRMPPDVELQAFLADRRQHVEDLVMPALNRGDVVIVDRYYYSTVAYQGARGMDPDHLLQANSFAPRPDLVVLLDVPPRIGLGRIAGRGDTADLFEEESNLDKARAIFKGLKGDHILRLDGTSPALELHGEIVEHLMAGPLADKRHLYRRQVYSYITDPEVPEAAPPNGNGNGHAATLVARAEAIAADDSIPNTEKAAALLRATR